MNIRPFMIRYAAFALLMAVASSCQKDEVAQEDGQVSLQFEMDGFSGFTGVTDTRSSVFTRAKGDVKSGTVTIGYQDKSVEYTVAASTTPTLALTVKTGVDDPRFSVPVGATATDGLLVWGMFNVETDNKGTKEDIYVRNTGEATVTGATSADHEATAKIPIAPATARLRFTLKGAFGEKMTDMAAIPFGATVAAPLLSPDASDPWDLSGDAPQLKGTETKATATNLGYIQIIPGTIKAGEVFVSELKPVAALLGQYTFTAEQQTIVERYTDREYVIRALSTSNLVLEAGKQYDFTLRLSGGIEATVEFVSVSDFLEVPEQSVDGRHSIRNEADLKAFATDWNDIGLGTVTRDEVVAKWSNDGTADGAIVLENDITLSSAGFTTIGSNANPFDAVFDGGAYTIDMTGQPAVLFDELHADGMVRGLYFIAGQSGYPLVDTNSGTLIACSADYLLNQSGNPPVGCYVKDNANLTSATINTMNEEILTYNTTLENAPVSYHWVGITTKEVILLPTAPEEN